MMIARKALPRRTVLRGMGAALALPLLDGMVPALTALAKTPARVPARFCTVYVPNGIIMEQWTPADEGAPSSSRRRSRRSPPTATGCCC